ncbi:MAG TPA: hypothetical protein VMN04_15360 [Thermoanaerobaculia bacterium]|nr:hypothetical protein [Thermoanaerobaculia bacterium]
MLTALALLAVLETIPSPTVELTLTGTAGAAPVSAAPRSLSDVARELREGRRAVGGFSAVETTVPWSREVYVPAYEWEDEAISPPPPEVVAPPAPAYETAWIPAWYGGGARRPRVRPHPAFHTTAPGPGRLPAVRPSTPPARTTRPGAGVARQRPG